MPMIERPRLSLHALRNWILTGLAVGATLFAAVAFSATQRLSQSFGPQVRADLEWRAQRGAQELALASDLGLVLGDAEVLRQAFGVHAEAADVQAIVAMDTAGRVVAVHGEMPESAPELFRGAERSLRAEASYLVSWAGASIEGTPVGRVALVVSTKRLAESRALLARASNMALFGGLGALLLGVALVSFYTRAVTLRDAQLSNYAGNLERMVEDRTRALDERNRGLRLVLDNVAQGFITVDRQGVMAPERSAIIDRWFGVPEPGVTLARFLERHAPLFATSLELNLMQLSEGCLPDELIIDQLPRRLAVGAMVFDIDYTPVASGAAIEQLLVIVSDVTEQLAHERAEREQRELIAIFQRILVDRASVVEFLKEGGRLVHGLETEADPLVQRQLVHTLKGISGMYGLSSLAHLAHEMESELAESDGALSEAQRALLKGCWQKALSRVESLLGGARTERVEIERAELEGLIERACDGLPRRELLRELRSWGLEPVERRLEQLGRQALGLARRLGKPEPALVIEGGGVRLDGAPLAKYWATMVHAVRNAVDHGLEGPAARVAAGKPGAGRIALGAAMEAQRLRIWLEDDGPGIDWQRVRDRAQRQGLPTATRRELIDALFEDGFTTREAATETSGRGVGLAALRQAVRELGGRVDVDSSPGRGTRLSFTFPATALAVAELDRSLPARSAPPGTGRFRSAG